MSSDPIARLLSRREAIGMGVLSGLASVFFAPAVPMVRAAPSGEVASDELLTVCVTMDPYHSRWVAEPDGRAYAAHELDQYAKTSRPWLEED